MITNKGFYLLRAPLMPVEFLTRFLQLPYEELADEIKQVFTTPYLAEAIYIASPELSSELRKWQEGQVFSEKDQEKLVLSLFRYLLRMSTRCTPYGLFAGCSTGYTGSVTDVYIQPVEAHKQHCRLDMNYVAELAETIARIPAVQEQLRYFPNNSIYRTGDTYRYAAFTVKNKFRQYDLTAVNHSVYLENVLTLAEKGVTREALYQHITDDDITVEEFRVFIDELIDSQILISELEPTVTGEEFFHVLIDKLSQLEDVRPVYEVLYAIREQLGVSQPGIEKYLHTHALVKQLLPETKNKDLVQTDLFLATTTNTISTTVINNIQAQMEMLWKLSAANKQGDLLQFCKAFSQRYEEQEISLALALDTETGIGYGAYTSHYAAYAPLLEEIVTKTTGTPDTIPWNNMREFQLKQYMACLQAQQSEVVLTDEDIDSLATAVTVPIPDSFYMMGSIVSESAAAMDKGDYLFDFTSCGGPSAGNLLGRFCHGDPALKELVRECLDEEADQQPDVIYAEIIHLPEARTGNILLRPQLRDYEIVYLGNGSVAEENQIPVTDLMVCVQNEQVILRSKRFNKRIIPRLSTAHNFTKGSLPMYKFLCDLQFQQLRHATGWQWQLPVEAPFLPRVRYKDIVLQKSTWLIHSKDHPALQKNASVQLHFQAFSAIKEALKLPRYISIADGDNELFIDLENTSCVHLLVTTLLKREQLTLQEVLQTPEQCWVAGVAGRFTNEIILPFKSSMVQPAAITRGLTTTHTQRHFPPGSEWLYVKIYAGINTAEKILTSVIKPLVEQLEENGIIDQWFFIRYTDPEDHIRLRFHHSSRKDFWTIVLAALHARLAETIDPGLIHRIQTDTYVRELERYGATTMAVSEHIFSYDSKAVLGCIDLLEGEEGEHFRWLLAIRGVDMLMDDFGYTLTHKSTYLKRLQHYFFREFGGGQALQTQLNTGYRKHMRQISSFLDPQQDADNEIEEAIQLLQKRSSHIRSTIQEVAVRTWDDLLSSYIHMFLNRMLSSNQRKHELVIYHFLSKYYESRVAMLKQQQLS
ncbi:thiopeptide-type bacteriocin biosynthesis domain-containing protein [Chitinophaga sp. YR627]|uniref:lantibiotic dehydratase n=1 Tax=Chitinophaga sp. YR627 TaxID=1881041 RepID=UPI0008E8D7E9|nr:lantibiotic dehydratase [Chitinophaga sp. YR627]SFN53187.1 thiopeptide-type bacteriocin biosynthesis domain-containing protein [Chitinophaga sp. YR627]